MVSSLHQRNYRLFFFGQLVSVAGTWMQTVAQSFLVLGPHPQRNAAWPDHRGPVPADIPVRPGGRRVRRPDGQAAGPVRHPVAVRPAGGGLRHPVGRRTASSCGSSTCWPSRSASSTSSTTQPGRASSPRWSQRTICRTPSRSTRCPVNMARVFGAALGGVIAAAIGLALCFALQRAVVRGGAGLAGRRCARPSCSTRQAGPQKQTARSGRACATCERTPELLIPLLMIAVIGTLAWEFQVTLPLMASQVFHRGAGRVRRDGLGDGCRRGRSAA